MNDLAQQTLLENGMLKYLAAFLKKLDVHNEKEADILQEAFEREPGGES